MKTRTGATTSLSKFPKRTTRAKVDYNVHKLAESAFKPATPITKRTKGTTTAAAKKKKGTKKTKRGGPTYLALVKRILKAEVEDDNHTGLSILALLKHIEKQYPERASRRYLRLALARGVENKSLVQTRQSFRLSAKEKKRTSKKRRSTKKANTTKQTDKKKRTTGTKRKQATTKSTKTKDTNKEKSTTKKTSSKKPAKKKARTSEASGAAEVRGTIAEGEGKAVWQYYDNGWHNYETSGSDVVEGVYQEYKTNTNIDVRAVQSGYFKYQVDFTNLQQTNIQTGTVRNIQRILQN